MTQDPASLDMELTPDRPLRLRDAGGAWVHCLRGTIWITSPGKADDIFLRAGESYRIERRGVSLLESIGNGRVVVTAVADSRFKRWLPWLFSRTGPAPSAPDFPA
ncbi:MAG: hypothetical protein H6R13_2943 [Proteobacteria bacterium]|nr:hypothetical protein [Pseudomonadota bacterium]